MIAQTAEEISMEILEHSEEWSWHYSKWPKNEDLKDYPFIRNETAPFSTLKSALPMLNLMLISSAGAYIEGTTPFDTAAEDGDLTFREIPIEVEAADIKFAARGYDPAAARQDMNAQIPVQRLLEYQANGVIGQLNPIWFSFCGHIPNAAKMADEMLHRLRHRIDVTRRAGHRLRQHAALPVEHAGREIAALAHDRRERGAHQHLRLFLDHRDQAVPHDLQVYELGGFGHGKPLGWDVFQV